MPPDDREPASPQTRDRLCPTLEGEWSKMRVLFVDDEQCVLDGLKRSMRDMRSEWDMEFADSGDEALKIMDRCPCDAVFTDMRMPVMDGLKLLAKIRDLHPGTMRFVLSGHTDRDVVLRSTNLAHQFLNKPCESERLRQAVSRARMLIDVLECRQLRSLVARVRNLPVLPALYHEIVEEINRPEPSQARISAIVEQDVGMTAKILQLVNSAFFGSPRRALDASDAVNLLGLDTLRALITAIHIFGKLSEAPRCDFNLDAFERHSLKTGALAKAIALKEGWTPDASARAFMAGVLHDVGEAVLATAMPSAYDGVGRTAAKMGGSRHEWESKILGGTHAELGGFLLGLWGFPWEIVEAVTLHILPGTCPDPGLTLVDVVHAADGIEICVAEGAGLSPEYVDVSHYQNKGLGDNLTTWHAQASSGAGDGTKSEDGAAA
jgi:HD-like signal output (HDOD) protein